MSGPISAMAVGLPLLCVTLTAASQAEPQCHSNDRYQVVALPYADDAGNRFAVTHLDGSAPTACVFDESKADLVIGRQGDPLWFAELADSSLILSRSTGPEGDLVVYDLASGKPILDVPADDYELKGSAISFWQRTDRATADNCPGFAENAANGFGSVTSVLKVLDLGTKTVTATGESKCVAVQ